MTALDIVKLVFAHPLESALAGALAQPMPDPAGAAEGVFCEGEPEPLGDGRAPWSGYRGGGLDG